MVTIPAGEDSLEAQPMPQEDDHDQREEEDNEKKKKVATRLKAKKMKTTLLGAMPRRMRHSMMSMRLKLLEMKPQSPLAD
jgi:hypothetical protein